MVSGNFTHAIGQVLTARQTISDTTPTLLTADPHGHPIGGRRTLEVFVPEDSECSCIYIGGKDVTVDTGIPVETENSRIWPLNNAGQYAPLYAIANAEGEVVVAEYTE